MKTFKVFLFLLFLLVNTQAQDLLNMQKSEVLDRENKKYESSLEKFYKNRSVLKNIAPQVLDDELNPEEYMVGPGDQFSLHLFGELETEFVFSILPEGEVDIPTVGSIPVNGLSLKEAKKVIYDKVRSNYINADLSIKLISLRKFRVYITGEIQIPGTYFAQGSDRVSDIIEVAGGLTDWGDDTVIEIIHNDGSKEVINLSKFYRDSDKSQNPFIRGGDVIHANSIDLTKPYVLVESRIQKVLSGTVTGQQLSGMKSTRNIYSLLPQENIDIFLRRISAYSAEIDMSNITLRREGKEITIDLLNSYNQFHDYKLFPRDLLILPLLVSEVYVQGEVTNPGSFPFTVNLRAKDYAGMAGILESASDQKSLKVIRAGTNEVDMGGDVIVEKGDTVIVGRKFRETFKDYITILAPVVTLFISAYTLSTR